MLNHILRVAFGALLMLALHEVWHALVAKCFGYSVKLKVSCPHVGLAYQPEFRSWREAVWISVAGFGGNMLASLVLLFCRFKWPDLWPMAFVVGFMLAQAVQFILYPFLIGDQKGDFYYLCPQYRKQWEMR